MIGPARIGSPRLFFFRQFLKNPGMIGSIIPTARATVNALLDPVDLASARCVVEYGPGTGVFTRAILARAAPDARVIAIDINADFTDYLRETIDDRRLLPVAGSAADVERIVRDAGEPHADYVISGLPFSTLPEGVDEAIVAATARAIRPGGQFLVYQYSRYVLPLLERHFVNVRERRSWLCVPPAMLFWSATKQG